MKHIHETRAFFSKIRNFGDICVNGSQNEFVECVTRVFIMRMHSLGQNRPLLTEHHICGRVN